MLVPMSLRRYFVVSLVGLLCVLCIAGGVGRVFGVDEREARQEVGLARSSVAANYSAVVDAERAGANVSDLLVTLNEAGDLLSRADLALNRTDFSSAVALASQSQQKLENVTGQAQTLRDSAAHKASWDFTIYVVGSILGTAGVLVASFDVWVFLKRRYGAGGAGSA